MSAFRRFLRAPDDPRIAGIASLDAQGWAERMLANPRAGPLFRGWQERYRTEAFRGITTDGTPLPGLFRLGEEGAPSAAIAQAALRLLALATPEERSRLAHPADSRVWHAWMNPEVYMHRFGLRLEEVGAPLREAILGVLEASLSEQGFRRARDLMRINHFLGELVGGSGVMNEWSYNFNLFGDPGGEAPWGWNFYGHHLCLNCRVLRGQVVFTPVFMGAEPNCIDEGPHAGTTAFADEERLGLELMRSLPAAVQARAQLYSRKRDPAMPAGRVALGDELHLCGAFQDNRVVPYEGVPAGALEAGPRRRILELTARYLAYQPRGAFEARLRDAERHLDQTHFCWIGGLEDESPFYYRLQSPVLVIEFDHHAGVFLANPEPEKFHIHTLVRTPNGNDYGMDLVRQHCELARRQASANLS